MIALKTILFPTDFSDYSMYALEYAVGFARQFRSRLVIMHVVDIFLYDPAYFAPYVPDQRAFDDFEKRARERIAEIAREKIPPGIEVETVVKQGRPFAEIVREARERGVDLIVTATHGRTGITHVLFGSNAEKIVRHAPCPVLSIKHPEHEFVMP